MNVKIDITGKNLTTTTSQTSSAESKDGTELLYKRYCQCRDQELERFWKSSAFVWTFLGVCFAAEGVLITKYMDNELHYQYVDQFPFFNSFICIIGFILSCIWLQMAKAEKVWYEVYEMAIWEIESFRNAFKVDNNILIQNFWTSKDDKDGTFSPSKLVLSIGQLLKAFWCIMFVFGLYFGVEKIQIIIFNLEETIIDLSPDFFKHVFKTCIWEIIFIILGLVAVVLGIIYIIKAFLKKKSSEIRTKIENDIFVMIKDDAFIRELGVYFEVKNNVVSFIFDNNNIDKDIQIKDYYSLIDDTKEKDLGKKLSFNLKKIINYYNMKNNDLTEECKDILHGIVKQTTDVKIIGNTLYIYMNQDDFIQNARKITSEIDEFACKYKIVNTRYQLINNKEK